MENLTIQQLFDFIKQHSPELVRHAGDFDQVLLERKPIELLLWAQEIQCSLNR